MKKDLGRRAQLLGGLMDSLDIVDPADFSDQEDTTNNIKSKRKNRELLLEKPIASEVCGLR